MTTENTEKLGNRINAVQDIPLERIRESKTNPRRTDKRVNQELLGFSLDNSVS